MAKHTLTDVSPLQLKFGHHLKLTHNSTNPFDTNSFQAHLCAKLTELQDFVASNSVQLYTDSSRDTIVLPSHSSIPPGDLVWPSVPTADKLTLHWEGLWNVDEVRNAVNIKIPIIPSRK